MLLLAVLSVVFMLGLGFVAIVYALSDIEDGIHVSRANAGPAMPGTVTVGSV